MSQYDWYREFFKKKVLPGLLREMQPCSGLTGTEGKIHVDFYVWLKESDRDVYDEISLLEDRFNEIWKMKSSQEAFRKICQKWVMLHLRVKPAFLRTLVETPAQGSLL